MSDSDTRHDPRRFYDSFYARGGWTYDLDRERETLAVIAKLAGWKPGDPVVEIGAGLCVHAELLRQAGFDVTAVELSPMACEAARERYPDLQVVCASASAFRPPQKVAAVFARGMSFYHYELGGVNCKGINVPAETARLMDWVRVGGTFVLQIATDLSGRRPAGAVHHNAPADYRTLFEPHGSVVLYDWLGRPLEQGGHKGVICVTRRATKDRGCVQ